MAFQEPSADHVQVCDLTSYHAAAVVDLSVLSLHLPLRLTCLVVEAVSGHLIEFLVDAVVCQVVAVASQAVVVEACLDHQVACSDCPEVTLIPCLATHQAQAQETSADGHPCCHLTGQEKVPSPDCSATLGFV